MNTALLLLAGGLGVFLVGMKLIAESMSGLNIDRVRSMFGRLSHRRLPAVGLGAGAAALLQSSSATTVILLGFVNAGVVDLVQATCIIMGANIGTTITAVLISVGTLPIGELFGVMALAGALIVMTAKAPRVKTMGWFVAGTGLLFVGLKVMSIAAGSLAEIPFFQRVLPSLRSPVLLVLAGMAFTAIIQSSTATTGIVITLASLGLMDVTATFAVIMGGNVGTCFTAMLAAVGLDRDTKRAALIHLLFNAFGVVIFLPLIVWGGEWIGSTLLQSMSPASLIAYFHVVFNLVSTVLLLPFVRQFAAFSAKLIPDEPTNVILKKSEKFGKTS